MERRNFLKGSLLAAAAASGVSQVSGQTPSKKKEVYEFRVYHMNRNLPTIDAYLSEALIPALNRHGVRNVGVFREVSQSEPFKVYVLIPYSSLEDYSRVTIALRSDAELDRASQSYNALPASRPIFERVDVSLLLAFDGIPQMVVPRKDQRLFEMRIYEGHNEDAVRRKVKMFNEGEMDIFRRVNVTPVFFGENIAGRGLPCLTYMTVYESMEQRDKAFKAFLDHPDWKKLSQMPEYADTVSKVHRVFLQPVPYSQV